MAGQSSNCLVIPGLSTQFANGQPLAKDCAAVDFGSVTDLPDGWPIDVDLVGGQRIYNAKIDAGCYEFDWRPDFARQIFRSTRMTVLAAPPEATLCAGGVYLPAGMLELSWQRGESQTHDHVVAFSVSGDGTLAVAQGGGIPAVYAKGAYSEVRELDVGENRFAFVYSPAAEDAGGAVIGSFAYNVGMTITFR